MDRGLKEMEKRKNCHFISRLFPNGLCKKYPDCECGKADERENLKQSLIEFSKIKDLKDITIDELFIMFGITITVSVLGWLIAYTYANYRPGYHFLLGGIIAYGYLRSIVYRLKVKK